VSLGVPLEVTCPVREGQNFAKPGHRQVDRGYIFVVLPSALDHLSFVSRSIRSFWATTVVSLVRQKWSKMVWCCPWRRSWASRKISVGCVPRWERCQGPPGSSLRVGASHSCSIFSTGTISTGMRKRRKWKHAKGLFLAAFISRVEMWWQVRSFNLYLLGSPPFYPLISCACPLTVPLPVVQGLFNLTCVSEPYNHIERVLKALVGISSSPSLEVSEKSGFSCSMR